MSHCFKLVTLHSGADGTPLVAAIKHAPVVIISSQRQLQPLYHEALLYIWGTSFVDDHLYITPNSFLDVGPNMVMRSDALDMSIIQGNKKHPTQAPAYTAKDPLGRYLVYYRSIGYYRAISAGSNHKRRVQWS